MALKTCLLLTSIAVLGITPALANWGSDAGGSVATGSFRAHGTQQVEMLRENLSIRLFRDHANVEVDYTFRNPGPAIDVTAGFPSLSVQLDDEDGVAKKHTEIENYSIAAEGVTVGYTRETGDPAPLLPLFESKFKEMAEFDGYKGKNGPAVLDWLTSTVHFNAGEQKHVRIRYESNYANCAGGYSDDTDTCADRFAYVLSTGSAWKGPIVDGKITIEAVTVDPNLLILSPKSRFQRSGNTWVWSFQNLKPTMDDNIVVSLNNAYTSIANYPDETSADPTECCNYYVKQHGKYSYLSFDYIAHAEAPDDDHAAANVREQDPKMMWQTARTPGTGAFITLSITKPAHIDQVGIVPGCGPDKTEWFSHARIQSVEVAVNNSSVRVASLQDDFNTIWRGSPTSYHWMNLPAYKGDAKEIRITIRNLFPGAKDQLTCIDKIMLREWLPSRPKFKSGVDGHELP